MRRLRTVAASLAAVVTLTVTAAALAPAALAAVTRPPTATGSFRTWPRAQHAAGFRLLRPTRTYHLSRSGPIVVSKCQVTGKMFKRDVLANYGSASGRFLAIEQDNYDGPCGTAGTGKKLGTYKVQGVTATLRGTCGSHTGIPCHPRHIYMFLTWTKRSRFYIATCHGELKSTIVGFARHLRPVK